MTASTAHAIEPIICLLSEDREVVSYRKRFAMLTDSVTAAILLQQMLFNFQRNGFKPFYKFRDAAPSSTLYRDGDSWLEELAWNPNEFDNALKVIGTKVTKGISKKELFETQFPDRQPDETDQTYYERMKVATSRLIIYWRDGSNTTWYAVNIPLLATFINRIYLGSYGGLKHLRSSIIAPTLQLRRLQALQKIRDDHTSPEISTEIKDSAPQSAAPTLLELSEQISPSIQSDPVIEPIVTEKADATDGEGTTAPIPNSAAPLSPSAGQADENAPERAASPTTREFSATTAPVLSAPDAPIAKPKRGRKTKPATPEEQASVEVDRADFEDAKLAVCYAWQKNPLKDPRGWVWVTMMANFLMGRVGKKQQGSQWDALKLDDTPLTAAQICGFRAWWNDPERLVGMEAPPIPTVLETLQRRVQEYVADRRIGRFAEQGAAKLAEVRAEYERATGGAPPVARQPDVTDEHDMIDQDRLAQLQAMIARSAALHGRREEAA